nr:hypothetical protein [Bacteroidota bacterium]
MPLLKRLLLCLCLISSISLSAQLACGTVMEDDPYYESLFLQENQNVSMESFASSPSLVIKIKFWDVAFDNGDNPEALSVEQMLGVVANLNKTYNSFNIFFKFDGKGQVNATEFRDIDTSEDSNEPDNFMSYLDVTNQYD